MGGQGANPEEVSGGWLLVGGEGFAVGLRWEGLRLGHEEEVVQIGHYIRVNLRIIIVNPIIRGGKLFSSDLFIGSLQIVQNTLIRVLFKFIYSKVLFILFCPSN